MTKGFPYAGVAKFLAVVGLSVQFRTIRTRRMTKPIPLAFLPQFRKLLRILMGSSMRFVYDPRPIQMILSFVAATDTTTTETTLTMTP